MGMALQSPGVEVNVIDESFYTPAAPGTTPLIVVATGENKSNAAGSGTARGTLASSAGNAFRVTSQRELVDLFGVPFFEKSPSGTPIHGSERNEYGLLAAYSMLGVINSAFIVRADVDLDSLEGQAEAPGANPDDGTWWVDTRATRFGIQQWNGAPVSTTGGQKFVNKVPTVLTDRDASKIEGSSYGRRPKPSVGSIGDYAVVFETVDGGSGFAANRETARIYFKSAGNTQAGVAPGEWVLVGSPQWRASWPIIESSSVVTGTLDSDTFTINGQTITINGSDSLDDVVATINGTPVPGVTAKNVNSVLKLYYDGAQESGNAITLTGTGLAQLNLTAGTYNGVELEQAPHTSVPTWKAGDENRPTGSVWLKTTDPNLGARWRIKRWSNETTSWVESNAPLYSSPSAALFGLDRAGGGSNIPLDSLFVQYNANYNSGYDETPSTTTFRVYYRSAVGNTVATSAIIEENTFTAGTNTFSLRESSNGEQDLSPVIEVTFQASAGADDAFTIAGAINAAGLTHVEASVTDDNRITISHKQGGDIRLIDDTASLANIFTPYSIDDGSGTANFYQLPQGASSDSTGQIVYLISNWEPLASEDFKASPDDPTNEPADGQLWYNPEFSEVDVMYHNGTTWVGYQYDGGDLVNFGATAFPNTDPNGPQVSATEPTKQSDGTPLVDGDLWISTANIDDFPDIYRYNFELKEFVQLDTTDQVTEDGVLFADARYGVDGPTGNTAASIRDLLKSNFLDFDAPDPALYPRGMLLFNTRRSGGNVKRYQDNYVDTTADNPRQNDESMQNYATDRWTTASPNQEDGRGSFGRYAQRVVVTQALKSVIDTSQQIRDTERRNFNLIACPGYTETMSNLVNLNISRGLTAFVIGDTPFRLPDDATSISSYATNENLVVDNSEDGLVTFDEYLGVFYPNGFTTDLSGTNVVVPASHMMLRTIALSDNVSFPWFAPAGTRRGGITNSTAVGYIDAESGEFQTVALNEGQRDTLYVNKINPIPFFVGVGLVNYGQKTRARNASALDRINVVRLVAYLRGQLDRLARPYVFEPNDQITRDEIRTAVESLLLELVGLRAIGDFAVVCDESNNTPARVDRNELYVDIAIEPIKAVEFIYIPLRVQNTGEI